MAEEVISIEELKKMWYNLSESNPAYAYQVLQEAADNKEEWALEIIEESEQDNEW